MIRVYLDTSVISALLDIRTPERMAQTKHAWESLSSYEVYISEVMWLSVPLFRFVLKHLIRKTDEPSSFGFRGTVK